MYFDLLGLPPSPEEIDAFLADKSPEAFEKVVDERLASPQYLDSLGTLQADGLPPVLQGAVGAVDELAQDVEDHYKVELR